MSLEAVQALKVMKFRRFEGWITGDQQYLEKLIWQATEYPSIVMPDASDPLAVFGIVHQFGVGEAWMVTGIGFGERRVTEMLRLQREACRSMYKALRLHRLHMLVDRSREDAKRWAKSLGFVYESTAVRLSPDGGDREFWVWPHNEGEC